MRGGHAHEESTLGALLALLIFGAVDYFVDIADAHPFKPLAYLGLFFLLYFLFRLWLARLR